MEIIHVINTTFYFVDNSTFQKYITSFSMDFAVAKVTIQVM